MSNQKKLVELEHRLNDLEYQIACDKAFSLSSFLFANLEIPERKPKVYPIEDTIHFRGSHD